jgi:WD40 repeat protein
VDTGRLLWFSSKHWSWVDSVAFSPRGDYAVSSGADGWARIWNAENGQEIRRLPASSMLIQSVAFSPDGRFLLIGGEDPPYIRLWDIESGREVRSFMGHTAAVRRAVVSPDGQHVLSLGQDSTLRWWDLASGSQLRMIALGGCYLDPLASSVAIAPDGHHAVSCNLCAEVDVWDLDTGLRIRELVGHGGNVYEAVFSPDGRRIISCGGTDYADAASLGPQGKDNSIRVWDAESGTEIACLKGHGGNVNSVAVSPDGRYLLSGGNDMTVRLWNMPAAGLAAASRSAGLTA